MYDVSRGETRVLKTEVASIRTCFVKHNWLLTQHRIRFTKYKEAFKDIINS